MIVAMALCFLTGVMVGAMVASACQLVRSQCWAAKRTTYVDDHVPAVQPAVVQLRNAPAQANGYTAYLRPKAKPKPKAAEWTWPPRMLTKEEGPLGDPIVVQADVRNLVALALPTHGFLVEDNPGRRLHFYADCQGLQDIKLELVSERRICKFCFDALDNTLHVNALGCMIHHGYLDQTTVHSSLLRPRPAESSKV